MLSGTYTHTHMYARMCCSLFEKFTCLDRIYRPTQRTYLRQSFQFSQSPPLFHYLFMVKLIADRTKIQISDNEILGSNLTEWPKKMLLRFECKSFLNLITMFVLNYCQWNKCNDNMIQWNKTTKKYKILCKTFRMVNGKGVVDTARPLVCLAKFKVNDNKSNDSCVSLGFSMEANGLWIRNFNAQWRHLVIRKSGFYSNIHSLHFIEYSLFSFLIYNSIWHFIGLNKLMIFIVYNFSLKPNKNFFHLSTLNISPKIKPNKIECKQK